MKILDISAFEKLSNWNVSKLFYCSFIFTNTLFEQDLSSWKMSFVVNT